MLCTKYQSTSDQGGVGILRLKMYHFGDVVFLVLETSKLY